MATWKFKFARLKFNGEDFFDNEYEVEDRNRPSLSLVKNKLPIYVNLDFQCNQTFDIFGEDDKLLRGHSGNHAAKFGNIQVFFLSEYNE